MDFAAGNFVGQAQRYTELLLIFCRCGALI